jgi:hypothetical protein
MQSQIFYFHTGKIWYCLYTSYYYFQILDLKILCAAYTRANTVLLFLYT